MTDTPKTPADDVVEIIETITEDNPIMLIAMLAAGALVGALFVYWYLSTQATRTVEHVDSEDA